MKFCAKSFVAGTVFASVGIASVLAAGGIKSAQFNTNKVIFDGKAINVSANPMISVIKDGEKDPFNYMPLRLVLEEMGYDVNWDQEDRMVLITTKHVGTTTPSITTLPGTSSADKNSSGWSNETISGYWVSNYTPEPNYYKFDKDGNYMQKFVNSRGNTTIYKGTYVLGDNKITFYVDYSSSNGDVTTYDNPEPDERAVEFAADGSSWGWPDSSIKFLKDDNYDGWAD